MFRIHKFWRGMVHVYIVLDGQRFSLTWSQDVYVNIVRKIHTNFNTVYMIDYNDGSRVWHIKIILCPFLYEI